VAVPNFGAVSVYIVSDRTPAAKGSVRVRQLSLLAGTAMEMLATAIHTGKLPQEHTVLAPTSFPTLDQLRFAMSGKA
jgi:hypothetical protein